MLTDKSKEKFEEWYLSNNKHYDKLTVIDAGKLNQFYRLPLVCQQALIVEFCRFMWYDVFVLPYASVQYLGEDWVGLDETYSFFIYERGKHIEDGTDFSTYSEALTKAIEKANEIINLK